MVYDVDKIAARLAAGDSMEDIAAEVTEMLNAAAAKHDEAVKAAEAEKQATYKRIELKDILFDLASFLDTYYPGMFGDLTKDMTEADRKELMDLVVEAVIEALDKTMAQMKNPTKWGLDPVTMALMADMLSQNHLKTPAPDKQPKAKSEDDVLNDFLNKICH